MRGRRLIAWVIACVALLAAGSAWAKPVTWIDWTARKDGGRVYHADGLRLSFAARADPNGDPPAPVLTVTGRGLPALRLVGAQAYDDAAASAIVARFDPESKAPVVIFVSYSGGAHCCYVFIVAKPQGDHWRTWRTNCDCDLQRAMVRVLAAGQPPALILPDEGFDGAFAAHSGSVSPPRIYQFRRGALFDVSGDPAFRAVYRRSMGEALGACRRGSEPNGGCAALVAEGSLAGQAKLAWKEALAHYDRSSQTYPSGCRVRAAPGVCDGGAWIVFDSFPKSLGWFLWRQGYAPAAPPFPCASDFCPAPWPDGAPPPA
jgi:hypothetical protein